MRVPELKTMLEQRGLSSVGKKADLVARLLEEKEEREEEGVEDVMGKKEEEEERVCFVF
jgi:hypothetical protein